MNDIVTTSTSNSDSGSAERIEKGIEVIEEILSINKRLREVRAKTKRLRDVKENYNRRVAISLINEFARSHKNFINMTTIFTDVYVAEKLNYYDDQSDDRIISDIQFLIFIVYLKSSIGYGIEKQIFKGLKPIFDNFIKFQNVRKKQKQIIK